MSTAPAFTDMDDRRELARRVGGGIEVTLYWSADDDRVTLEVWRPETEELLTVEVPREQALSAFHHPFAYLAA